MPKNETKPRLKGLALPSRQQQAQPADQTEQTDAAPGASLRGATGKWCLDEDLDHSRRLVVGYRRIQQSEPLELA